VRAHSNECACISLHWSCFTWDKACVTLVIASAVVAMLAGSARVASDVSRVVSVCSESRRASEEVSSVAIIGATWKNDQNYRVPKKIEFTITGAFDTARELYIVR
jgi:hypothetical protein